MHAAWFVWLAFVVNAPRADDGTKLAPLFEAQVDRRLDIPESEQRYYAELLAKELAPTVDQSREQYVLLVDRSPKVQAAMIYWHSAEGDYKFVGASPVATGKPGQFDHFETPLGVFDHSLGNPDFRAEGTKNELGIRGYGRKGMRIFDFGWQRGIQGWGHHGESPMRLQVHATDPDLLEPYLGNARSKGCVRIPASLNVFLDRYGILDAGYDEAASDGQTLWVLPPGREPTPWSGRYLVVVDSKRTARPEWSPGPK